MGHENYDFSGWATKNGIRCSDGRTIMRDAFKHNDGQTVPIVWNHSHNEPDNVLGHGILENREDGVYVYGTFNDTKRGRLAKNLVQHGDIAALSIYANRLKQNGGFVMHGDIREVSLVFAGANPGAYIENVIQHGDSDDGECAVIFTGEDIELSHTDMPEGEELRKKKAPTDNKPDNKEDDKMSDENKKQEKDNGEETVGEVWETLTEKQKTAVYAIIAEAVKNENGDDDNTDTKGGNIMKHNIFDNDEHTENYLSHADEENILKIAKSNSVGSLKDALDIYASQNDSLAHGFEQIDQLFPDYKDVNPGAPELLTRDMGWVSAVMQKCKKSPISRIRTRQADIRSAEMRASGHKKGKEKANTGNIKLLKRTTDPQTIYIKDALHRDDIVDITDFDTVQYQYNVMRQLLNEELARAIFIGDGRDDGDDAKISEEHIRSIWHDDDLYAIHATVDVAKAKKELQGTDTEAYFGENYIYSEAIISAALYAREKYKGSGKMDFFCTEHLLNVMLLARDRDGRRIYNSASDLSAALNVGNIYTVEQFEGQIRTTSSGMKSLLGIFVNLADYQLGSTKGGQVTSFNQFDIDFNQEKYLIETRVSGALVKPYSAIVLEEPVDPVISTTGKDDIPSDRG